MTDDRKVAVSEGKRRDALEAALSESDKVDGIKNLRNYGEPVAVRLAPDENAVSPYSRAKDYVSTVAFGLGFTVKVDGDTATLKPRRARK